MKKTLKKVLTLAMVAAMVLAGCGTPADNSTTEQGNTEADAAKPEANKDDDKHQIKDLVISKGATRELSTFNLLYSQSGEDGENLTNLVDGLLEVDNYGHLKPAIAEEWGTEDGGLNWTFKLRDGVKWVDVNGSEKADCNAWDFATGLEWVLNFHKNDSANTSMPIEMIKGAEKYYEYTKTLSKEEAYALDASEGSKFMEMVGVTIPDDHTISYECIAPKPYFDTVATSFCLYPMNQGMVEELGGVDSVKAMNNENMWYNGCYTMTSYLQGNEKTFTKNPMYWDKDCFLFDSVIIKMVESNDISYQLFQNGEIDQCMLSESNIKIISGSESNEFHDYMTETIPRKYSYQIHFNFNKKNEDGTPDVNWNTAVANKAFRQSMYYGLNLENSWKRLNAINPYKCENLFYTMKGLCYTSDGKDYTSLVAEKLGLPAQDGKTNVRLDQNKAAELKKQAMEELTAQGVTFPVTMVHYIPSGSQNALDSANVLKQIFNDCLGTDYIDFQIKTYVSKMNGEVIVPHLHCFSTNGWGADYGDPQNYLVQDIYDNDNAYYSANYTYINEVEETPATADLINTYKEFTKKVEAADAITDNMDERYAAYAEAEAYLLENALSIPYNYDIGFDLTKINPYSKMNGMFGAVNDKMKNWETKADKPYSTEEMEQIAAEYAAAIK